MSSKEEKELKSGDCIASFNVEATIVLNVYFNGRFFMCPLKYEDETICELRFPYLKTLSFQEMSDILLDKTKEDIWKWFYCRPNFTLEEGLTVVENDRDVAEMFDKAKLEGYLNLYVCHIPQVCLVDYYYNNLGCLYDSDDDETLKHKSHKKALHDANNMSFEDIVAWEKKELSSPTYLRSPHVWKYCSKSSLVEAKTLLDDFDAAGDVKD